MEGFMGGYFSSGEFVMYEKLLTQSEVWRGLSGDAVKVFIEFRNKHIFITDRKTKKIKSDNWNDLSFTYREAETLLKFNRNRFKRAINELIEKGFIRIERQSGGLEKKCNIYSLSAEWKNFGKANFNPQEIKKDTRNIGFKSLWKNDRMKMLNSLNIGIKNDT